MCIRDRPDTVDDNGNNPFLVYGWPKDLEFDQYLDKIEEKITEKMAQGCVALKSSLPYDRSIHFKERTYDEAKRGYQNPDASREDIVAFQDYIYFYICRIAAKYDICLLYTSIRERYGLRERSMKKGRNCPSKDPTGYFLSEIKN